MKTKILLSLLALAVLAGCGKDKYNTAPTLTLKSVGEKVIPKNGSLRVQFEITDDEGDISDTLYFKKVRKNRRPVATTDDLGRDSLTYPLPNVNKSRTTIMQLDLNYDLLISSSRAEPDSLTFQFWITDKAKNKSNVYNIENIVVFK